MDVVIPHIKGHWDSLDLRYTLRSIEKFYPEHGQVILVGHKPDWYTGEWFPLNIAPNLDRPFMTTASMLWEAARMDISELFCWMDDDTLLLQPYRPHIYHMELQKTWGPGQYKRAWERTVDELKRCGIDQVKNYEVHAPMVYSKSCVLDLYTPEPYLFRTLYANSFRVDSLPLEDQKLDTWSTEPSGLFASTGDLFLGTEPARQWAERAFPDPSPWE